MSTVNLNEEIFGETVKQESEPGLAAAFEVRAIPTLAVLRDGVLLGAFPGVMAPAKLDELVRKVRELDMAEVRRELDEAQPPERRAAKARAA